MADQISNYQCPACTGPLHYDGKLGKLLCDYCGSSFSVQEIEALYKEKDEKAAAASAQAKEKEDDGEPFNEKMKRLTGELSEMFAKSHELEDEIKSKLEAIGYGI